MTNGEIETRLKALSQQMVALINISETLEKRSSGNWHKLDEVLKKLDQFDTLFGYDRMKIFQPGQLCKCENCNIYFTRDSLYDPCFSCGNEKIELKSDD